jgi:hypothetical protein
LLGLRPPCLPSGPGTKPIDEQNKDATTTDLRKGGGGGGEGAELALDPLLIALLKKAPDPDKGRPGPDRARWFRTFAMNVPQIYDGDGEPVEMKLEPEKEAAH